MPWACAVPANPNISEAPEITSAMVSATAFRMVTTSLGTFGAYAGDDPVPPGQDHANRHVDELIAHLPVFSDRYDHLLNWLPLAGGERALGS